MGTWLSPAFWGFVLPLVAVAWLVRLVDRGAASDTTRQMLLFVWGVAVAVLALVVELYVWRRLEPMVVPGAKNFVEAFLLAGLTEELCKVALIYSAALQHHLWTRRSIIAAALLIGGGFAGAENVVYVLTMEEHGIVVLRMMTAVPLHIANAVISAHFIHLAITEKTKQDERLAMALLVSIVLHGLYDYLILTDSHYPGGFLFALALAVTIAVRLARAKQAE